MVNRFLAISLLLLPFASHGNVHSDVGQMACGVGSQLPQFGGLALFIAVVLGILFVGGGLLKIKDSGHGNQGGSPNNPLKIGIVMIIVGGLLTSSGLLSLVSGNTMFGTDRSLQSLSTDKNNPLDKFRTDC